MNKPRLYIPPERTRAELERLLSSDDEQEVYHALIDAAYNDPDCEWIQKQCTHKLGSVSPMVRSGALYGLKLLTCVRHEVDPARALAVITPLLQNPESACLAQDTIDDLLSFYPELKP